MFVYTGGFDTIDGRGGSDRVNFAPFGAAVWVDLNNPIIGAWTSGTGVANALNANTPIARLTSIENVVGTFFSDVLIGNAGAYVFSYTGGFDTINGGTGVDKVDFSGFASAIWVDLNNPIIGAWTSNTGEATAQNANTAITRLTSVENVVGTNGS